ncbi:hypothetical protein MBRA1_000849 [Malassezia brasiliensis]|uniref:Mediator of RNA polymerase II transcription subunit 10 n=1 Tax=Malassezia brasiliensis TaxID=1821822 RepID=A0AAF0INY3_9BASI|nr:hypothetical protein MBRA1_000849 [Malassezia brasiliensis]
MDTPVTPTSASPSPPADAGAEPHDTHAHGTAIPIDEIVRRDLETRTRAVVDVLYELASRAADVQPSAGLGDTVNQTVRRLADIDVMRGHIHTLVPKDAVDLVDAGRNPDSHTRTFINRLASENQYSVGQHASIRAYRDELCAALSTAFPELAPSIANELATEHA